MRRVSQLIPLLCGLLLVTGCNSIDPTRFWKLNHGEDYMNNDQYFSVPPQPTPAPEIPEADQSQS
jgi:hypothetical protein